MKKILTALLITIPSLSFARDLDYKNEEVSVYVTPGEPTQIQFPGSITGGYKRKTSAISLERKDESLVIFPQNPVGDKGEAIIVELKDGRTYSIRIQNSSDTSPRDDVIRIDDSRPAATSEEENPPYREKGFSYAPPTQVSGLMREIVLNAEFGKSSIQGYRVSDLHKGDLILNDGTIVAKIDRMYLGPNLWGYVIDAENLLNQTQKINPASFRIDGTRAISASNWELAPKPATTEESVAAKHRTKIYIVAKAR